MLGEPETILLALAGITIVGFLGQHLFRATRFSDVLLLVGVGVLIGPVLHVFDPASLAGFAPVIGTFALLIILFDGGLDLRVRDLVQGLPRGTLLALAGFVFTVAAVAAAGHYVLGLDRLRGILLGCIHQPWTNMNLMSAVASQPESQPRKSTRHIPACDYNFDGTALKPSGARPYAGPLRKSKDARVASWPLVPRLPQAATRPGIQLNRGSPADTAAPRRRLAFGGHRGTELIFLVSQSLLRPVPSCGMRDRISWLPSSPARTKQQAPKSRPRQARGGHLPCPGG